MSEDCSSLICVRLDETGGVCSKACDGPQSCPSSDNWGCLPAPDQPYSVCACLPLAPNEICADGLDNDCNGIVDDCRTCDGQPVPDSDHENCGECGRACRSDQLCEEERCSCPATAPDDCDGRCTSTSNDALNCGRCGEACPSGQTCRAGQCSCPNPASPDYCQEAGCVDLRDDASHCGACGTACGAGQSCEGGQCVCPPGDAQDFCDGVGCVDFLEDALNCGGCGAECEAGQSCVGGECRCPGGGAWCGSACVDVRSDHENCGACGNGCPVGQACRGGRCGCSAPGLSTCADGCADLTTDTDNCGACGAACAEGERCNGRCSCDSGVFCGSSCMPSNDSQNCGACGNVCPPSQYCDGGRCRCQGFGLSQCGGECFDTSTDELHCGDCSTACRSGESCLGGDCVCPSAQQYCEGAGTCVALGEDASNCGGCGNACSPSQVCASGVCKCPLAGQLFCEASGKCVDTLSNPKSCGGCGTVCQPTEICSGGRCDCSGFSETYCATAKACVDLWTSDRHCGACDRACPAQTHCSGATCVCDEAGKTSCPNGCFDLSNDPDNCGACGNDCGGALACVGGKCRCEQPTVGAAVRLTNNALNEAQPAAAWDGTHVGLAYRQQIGASAYYNLRFALLNPDGTSFKDVALTAYKEGQRRGVGSSRNLEDAVGITWNGSEYGVVWDDVDDEAQTAVVRLSRVSAAGVATAAVGLGSDAYWRDAFGLSVVWSVPYGGYIVSGVNQGVSYRRVGRDGKALEPVNRFDQSYLCRTSIAVAPSGAVAVSCAASYDGGVGFFNPDGSRTRPRLTITTNSGGSAGSETFWNGAAFDTAVIPDRGGSVRLYRDGSSSGYVELLPGGQNIDRSAVDALWLGGSLALGTVRGDTYELHRFLLPTTPTGKPITFHDPVTVVSTPTIAGKPDLVTAGSGKLLLIWPDNRWGTAWELYAAPIDLKACP